MIWAGSWGMYISTLLDVAELLSKSIITVYIPPSQLWAVHLPRANHGVADHSIL